MRSISKAEIFYTHFARDLIQSNWQAEYFFSLGLDVNAVDKMGRSALYHTLEILKFILLQSLGPLSQNIIRRFRMNSTKLVEMLIERGADVDLADCDGVSPVHLLYEYEEVELLQLLVKHGADINWKNKKGRSLAHRVCDFPQKPTKNSLKLPWNSVWRLKLLITKERLRWIVVDLMNRASKWSKSFLHINKQLNMKKLYS